MRNQSHSGGKGMAPMMMPVVAAALRGVCECVCVCGSDVSNRVGIVTGVFSKIKSTATDTPRMGMGQMRFVSVSVSVLWCFFFWFLFSFVFFCFLVFVWGGGRVLHVHACVFFRCGVLLLFIHPFILICYL